MKILTIVVLSILLILNILLGIHIHNNAKNYKIIVNSLITCENELGTKNLIVEYFEKSLDQQRNTWNKSFNDVNAEISDLIISNTEAYLCLRISFHNCSKCIQTELKNLISATKIIDVNKIILLVNFQDRNQISYFKEEYNLPYKIVYCSYLNVGIENYKNPYYFVLKNNKIQYPFIPLKRKPELFKSYIQNISPIFNGFN